MSASCSKTFRITPSNDYREDKDFLAGFSVRDLVVQNKKSAASRQDFVVFKIRPRLRRGFVVTICIFVSDFHSFCLEKAQKFPAAAQRDLVIPKMFPASRRGPFFRFLRKVGEFCCYLSGTGQLRLPPTIKPRTDFSLRTSEKNPA